MTKERIGQIDFVQAVVSMAVVMQEKKLPDYLISEHILRLKGMGICPVAVGLIGIRATLDYLKIPLDK